MRNELALKMTEDCARQAGIQAKQTRVILHEKEINMVSGKRSNQ